MDFLHDRSEKIQRRVPYYETIDSRYQHMHTLPAALRGATGLRSLYRCAFTAEYGLCERRQSRTIYPEDSVTRVVSF